MARTDRDSWDLASSVGATATMVAAARAAASRRPNPVINDPFAEPLVRAVGLDLFTKVACGELDFDDVDDGAGFPRMVDTFAARARFYDDYFAEASAAGLRQVVIVASGLDARPYRLSWPAGTTLYEIDQPEVIEFKTTTLSDLGAVPGAEHRPVGIDLRRGLAGGAAERRLRCHPTDGVAGRGGADRISAARGRSSVAGQRHALSAAGSRFAADYGSVRGQTEEEQQQARTLTDRWREHGLDLRHPRLDLSRRAHRCRGPPAGARLGHRHIRLADLFATAGLAPLDAEARAGAPASIGFVRATRR